MIVSIYHVLKYAPSCPPKIIKKLGENYTLNELCSLSFFELQERGLSTPAIHYLQQQNWPEVSEDMEWAKLPHHYLINFNDPDYPPLLKEIPDPPLLLYGIGQKELLFTPQIAIVGTRKPTANGRETARQFASALARMGLTITSGLAAGIDGASHEGALQVKGKTIAILGNGLLHYYPSTHRTLQCQIEKYGLLLSEFSPKEKPRAAYFPKRNRIISGLSVATLVVEAATRSGSLITARLASEQGRDVFAIPGSIHNPEARGCHALIKQGAKLIETVDDILEEIRPLLQRQFDLSLTVFAEEEKKAEAIKLEKNLMIILEQIDYAPTSLEVLIERCAGMKESLFSSLMQLELAGYIVSSGAGYTRLAP
ncbi:MAG: DNA-protecting protein DprA [Legionellales bacterium]|nr:DNA-protecting protein DprA [Legionellales bacterium]